MTKTAWRSLLLVCLFSTTMVATAFALPSFSDKSFTKENLNPTDVEIVQEIDVTAASQAIILTSATVQNLGTAGSGQIDKIEILDGNPLGYTEDISGLGSGITINLNGYVIPASSTPTLKVRVTVGKTVNGGETVRLRVRFYYEIDGTSYTSSWITDGTGETIRNGGFDVISDTPQPATNFDPRDEGTVQISVFTDSDANSNNVFWTQTGSSAGEKILTVENLGTATTDDIAQVKVTLTIGGTTYDTGFIPWAPASPMPFSFNQFEAGFPEFITNNTGMIVKVEVKTEGPTSVTPDRTIRTKTTVFVKEGKVGNEQEYEQSITATNTQMIRNQGFEGIADESTPPPSGVAERDKLLKQIIKVTDHDVNDKKVTINKIHIRNTGTATGAELSKITIQVGATSTQVPSLTNLQAGIDVLLSSPQTDVDDDESQTITISYEIGTPVNGHTLQPIVRVQGREPDTGTDDYWSDEVTYPESVVLYQPGFEIVENITPPEGGTAYSGQRLLAQKIHLVDRDENDDSVTINPVVVKNIGSAQANPDITKIEVWRKDTSGGEELKLGEATDLAGLRTSGVTIPTLQDNIVIDKPAGSETFLYIYVTIAGPEEMTANRTLQLQTRVLHTETSVSYDKMATSNQWTLAINHRPVVDFTYAKVATASVGPKADFTYEDTIKFTSTVTDADNDAIASYLWDFDDGNTSTEANPSHQYPTGGAFDVTLTATDARGVAGSKTKTIVVEGPPNELPTADFTWDPAAPDTDEATTFTATVTDPDQPEGTPFTYAWDFGDGTTSAASSPQHAFTEKKAYTVTLVVTDAQDGSTTVTKTVSVGNEPPVATITVPATAKVAEQVTFDVSVTDPDQPEGTAFTYAWDFGDGTTSTAKNPTHTYNAAGTFTVSLVVTDDKEAPSAEVTKDIVVSGPERAILYSYPNPASTQASIVYYLPTEATDPLLHIYNITGALVFEQTLAVGESPYVWDLDSTGGTAQPNGLYLCIVVAKAANGGTIKSPIFKLLIAR